MTQPTVFISFSRQDEADKNELVSHLGVLQQQGLIDTWVDDQIGAGADWAKEIEQAICRAEIAILLITKNFLSSKFILQSQVKQLLERREQEGLIIFPIIARPCAWRTVPWLAKMKVRPKGEQPVWRDGGRYADEALAAIAEEIAAIMAQATVSTQSSLSKQSRRSRPTSPGSEGTSFFSQGSILPQILMPLNEALTRRTLTLFIGADLPVTVTGLPSRNDLARGLARRKGLDEHLSLAEVAQRVSQAGNRWEFTDFIRNALDTTGKSAQSFHQRVAALIKEYQIETIITTAYDNLLESAFQQTGLGLNRVVRSSDVNFINPDRPSLIKLYGEVQQPDTLVVTDRDHSDLLRDRDKEALIDTVRYTLRRNTVLFLGYNLADPDFRFLFDQVAESRFARTVYAIWPGLPEVDVQMWRDRGIVIAPAEPLVFLESLTANVSDKLPEDASLTYRQSESLADILNISLDHDGQPHKAGKAQWWMRLRVESKKSTRGLSGRVYDIRSLSAFNDQQGASLAEFHVSTLSWAREKGLFAPISTQIGSVNYLDLAWRAHGDPQIPADELRVASALDLGKRDTKAPDWGMRQDFIPLKPGYYLFIAEIMAEEYAEPVKRTYRLHWPGQGAEDDIRLTEIPLIGEKGMDYKCGLAQLRACLRQQAPDVLIEFNTLEERFYKNERSEHIFGSSENTRNEHSQIIYTLNELALKHCGFSFNDLCFGQHPPKTEATFTSSQVSDIKPKEDRADFVIITALEKEAKAVVKRLENHKVKRFEDKDIRTYHCGTVSIQGINQTYSVVVVLLPNMGNVAAANAVTDTIARWNPRFVLMVGIAGGIPQDDLDLGDVIVADQIIGYEYSKVTDKRVQPRDRVYPASALLLERVRNYWNDTWTQQIDMPRPKNATRPVSKLFIGPIASGNKVIASTKFRQQLTQHWPKLIGLEMEGEGVFAATFDRPQIPATLVIRGVSDMADERKSDEWQGYAANAAAAFAISFIRSGPVGLQ